MSGRHRSAEAWCQTCGVGIEQEEEGPFNDQDVADWRLDHRCEPDVVTPGSAS